MSTETTVLLLEAESLPSALEEHLTKRNVFVEHATGSDVGQMLPVIVPDLVVQSGDLEIEPTIRALKNEETPAPFVVIADRGKLRELKATHSESIQALIPKDLPIAAIAHRLAIMARRSVEGTSLEGEAPALGTRERPKASATAQATPAPPIATAQTPKSEAARSTRGSLAPAPLAPLQQVKIVDPEEAARRQAEREEAALREAEAQQRAVEQERLKKKAAAEEATRRETEKRKAKIDQQAKERSAELEERRKEQVRRIEERRREQERKREEKRKELEQRAHQRASIRAQAKKASLRPKSANSTPSEIKALDDLFPSETPEPATTKSSHPPEHVRKMDREAAEELEQTTQAVDISAFAPKLDKKASGEAERATSQPTQPKAKNSGLSGPTATKEKPGDFSSVKKSEDLSVIMPLPVDMRMDLSPKSALKPIRLALLDTDLTRADAVAAALRERGMKIHPVTPDPDRTRWPMLRRFAPQGLVVDEKSMARGAAEWVETFRGDPFLRHVPVILVRFSRVFDEAKATVTLDPLLHMIEHVGREEFALLEKLGPGRRVDLWLSQVAPYRLVEMLTKEDRNTRLDCKSDNERMVWHLGPGYAGRGKLADLKTDEPKQRLSPQEALAWLLSHEDCEVAVHEHAEPLAHASESEDAEGLLREMTEALGAPERHQSVRPGALSQGQKVPSLPGALAPPLSGAAAPSIASQPSKAPVSAPYESPQGAPPPPMRAVLGSAPIDLPMSRKPLFSGEQKAKLTAQFEVFVSALRGGYAAYANALLARLRPLESRVPAGVLRHAPWVIPLVALLLLLLLVLSLGGENGAAPEAEATPATSSTAAPPPEDKVATAQANDENKPSPSNESEGDKDDEKPTEDDLWSVGSPNDLPSCEQRLGASAPKGPDPARASGYWKNARRLLMLGNMEEAVESMCLAGLFDPAGAASEGLAEYYLGQRSLAQAERWIKESLKADPERRKSQELLGDIENQKGNIDQARKILLKTMRLSGDETKKMAMTARKLRQDARLARKGGDLPRAERVLRRAALLSPDDVEIATELGDVLLRREASAAAGKWAAHALKLDPNYSTAMLLSARVAEAQGRKDKAREFYEMVPLGDPNHDEAQRRRGRL